VQFQIARLNPAVGGHVYCGVLGEAGQTWQHEETPALSDLIPGFTAYLGAETPLGPMYMGYGYAEGGHQSLYVFLGRGPFF
jgi:NTE family protein